MRLDEFLDRLDGFKPNGQGYQARCPAHDDKTPSLSVAEGDNGGIIAKCHAGCSIKEIVCAMGLDLSDLHANNDSQSTPVRFKKTHQPTKSTPAPILTEVVKRCDIVWPIWRPTSSSANAKSQSGASQPALFLSPTNRGRDLNEQDKAALRTAYRQGRV